MATAADARSRSVGLRTLATRGALAVVGSLVVNWIVLGVALAGDLVVPFDPVAYPPVTLFTTLGALAATAVYGVLTRVSESPNRTFTILAAVVLVLSFVPDWALLQNDPNATVPAVTLLALLHVTTAVICVSVLTGRVP